MIVYYLTCNIIMLFYIMYLKSLLKTLQHYYFKLLTINMFLNINKLFKHNL